MFYSCEKLETAPKLPATKLADYCYSGMFYSCEKLETAPKLPATKLADYCYRGMFYSCKKLKTAPELPATTLAEGCYQYMFFRCTDLSSVTMLAPSNQITETTGCCSDWLYNAGTSATSRTLKVKDEVAYNALLSDETYLPAIWKKDGPCNVSW